MTIYLRTDTKEQMRSALMASGLCVEIGGELVAVNGDAVESGFRYKTTTYQPTDPREPLPPPDIDTRWHVNLRTNNEPDPAVLAALPIINPQTPDVVFG